MNEEAALSDGGNDADRRRWTHKRAQFDNAIHSARLLGFIQKLASGEARYHDILRTLREVNASADQSQYVAETLAMKKEVRGLARLEFHPEIAVFFTEVSRLIPQLTDGLASQVMMLLGHAAQNDVYLDTVSDAVSELLADLDHPLNREARNYLRLLWEQIEATRRLKQTEALFPGSSVPPPSSRAHPASRDSGRLPKATAQLEASPRPGEATDRDNGEPLGRTATMAMPSSDGAPATREWPEPARAEAPPAVPDEQNPHRYESSTKTIIGMAASVHLQPDWAGSASEAADRPVTMRGTGATEGPAVGAGEVAALTESGARSDASVPNAQESLQREAPSSAEAMHDKPWDEQTNEFFSRSEAPHTDFEPGSLQDNRHAVPISRPPGAEREPEAKLPTNSVPRWAVLTASLAVAGIVAAVVYVTQEPGADEQDATALPSATATARPPNAAASDLARQPRTTTTALPSAVRNPAAPPPPPPPTNDTRVAQPDKTAEPTHAVPRPDRGPRPQSARPVAPPRVAVDSPSVRHRPPKSDSNSAAMPEATAKQAAPIDSQSSRRTSASVVTPPDIANSMSPLDRIIAELRLISPDPVGIEEKARELSRIIAKAKRKDAFYIIDHLGPPVALDPLGRDPALEESLRTFAISTLGRVAVDDDDSRAVSAIFMLGEWAKSGGKGRQKAIAALESLGKDRIVKASIPRMKAWRAAKAQSDE